MSRLRILFIAGWYPTKKKPVNGIFVKEHAKAVLLYNDVIVLHSLGIDSSAKDFYEISDEVEDGIRTIRIKYHKSPIPKTSYFIYLWSMFGAFRRLLKEGFKPDIIHAHVYSAGVPAVILGRVYKIPVVITEHFTGFSRHTLTKWDIFQAKFAMRRAKFILPVSDDLRKHIEFYGIHNKFEIVPNVVNTELFHPASNKCEGTTKRILLVCLLDPKKGIPYLLQALSRLKKKREDFALDIVGDGPYRAGYEKQARDLGVASMVQFYGLKPKEEIAEFMNRCDIFVLPSIFETFGVVLIEALACGKPVITTNIGGPNEIIDKSVGLLVPPKDVDALVEAINYMLDHYQDYSPGKISQYAKEQFSYVVVGKTIDQVYRDILKENYEKYPTGNSGYKIEIKDDWKVLDVGSGHNPHPRANVVLDKYIEDNKERSGKSIKIRSGQRFIMGDACSMPFKDKEFDYVIASHIAEHVDNPVKFCRQLMRVSKRGYIETLSKFTEVTLGELFHKWHVHVKNNALIFERIRNHYPLGFLGKFFYAVFYINTRREGKKTLYLRNKYIRALLNLLVYYLLRKPWRIFKKITYTCFEWQGEFNYKIIEDKNEQHIKK